MLKKKGNNHLSVCYICKSKREINLNHLNSPANNPERNDDSCALCCSQDNNLCNGFPATVINLLKFNTLLLMCTGLLDVLQTGLLLTVNKSVLACVVRLRTIWSLWSHSFIRYNRYIQAIVYDKQKTVKSQKKMTFSIGHLYGWMNENSMSYTLRLQSMVKRLLLYVTSFRCLIGNNVINWSLWWSSVWLLLYA